MNYQYYLSTIPGADIVDNTYVRIPASKVSNFTMDYDGRPYLILDFNSPKKPEIAIKILPFEISGEILKYANTIFLSKDKIHPSVDTGLYQKGEMCLYEIYLKCKTVDQALLYKLSL